MTPIRLPTTWLSLALMSITYTLREVAGDGVVGLRRHAAVTELLLGKGLACSRTDLDAHPRHRRSGATNGGRI